MAFPADAKQRKLTRQFPGEDIWDLLQREMLRDVADWLREEMALRGWSYDAAQGWLETDGGHIWHIRPPSQEGRQGQNHQVRHHLRLRH